MWLNDYINWRQEFNAMADSKLTALSEVSVPALEDLLYLVDDPSGTPTSAKVSANRVGGLLIPGLCNGRLTLESGVPVSTSDQTGKTSVYFTPYHGNRIAIYDGTRWKLYSFTERTLALGTITADKNYDVFVYDNAGTLTLELSAAWTSDTARNEALTTQDGVYVKSGATTRRYLGTFRTTSTTETEDSATKRFLWNAYNRVPRRLQKTDTTSSWTYGTATIRQARGSTDNQVAVVVGLAESAVSLTVGAASSGTASAVLLVGIGEDGTTALAAECAAGNYTAFNAADAMYGTSHNSLIKTVPLGYHYYTWLEFVTAASTCTAFGDDTAALRRCGLIGSIQC